MNYNAELAGVLVTLASIANAKVGLPLPEVRAGILNDLANPAYATKAEWSLVWGPAVGTVDDNMLYVARQAQSGTFAIVLRGTVMKSVASMWEDVPKGQSAFPYGGPPGATVSTAYLKGLEGMLKVADASGSTLAEFLSQQASSLHGMSVYVCGHSQAGGIVAMMLGWLTQAAEKWNNSGETLLSAYASAGPGAGNPVFADWISRAGNFFQIINPLDTIPLWYGEIKETLTQNIPKPLGHSLEDDAIRAGIELWADWADASGPWAQPETMIRLDKVQLPDSVSFVDQAQNQHHHNSYLYLMGVPPIEGLPPSLLPKYGPPVPPDTC